MVEGLWQYPRPTYFMEEKIAKLEADMREQLEFIRMKDEVIKTQQDTMKEMTNVVQSLLMQASKGKSAVDRAIPDSEKYLAIPTFGNLSSSDSPPKHMYGNVPTQETPTILIRPSDLVHPPVQKDKTIPMFPGTLGRASHGQLINNLVGSSAGLASTGEYGGNAIKRRRTNDPYNSAAIRRHISQGHWVGSCPNHPPQNRCCNRSSWSPKPPRVLYPIPMSYTELLPVLIERKLLAPVQSKPKVPPYPKDYDFNATCDYHIGSTGHSTENCGALKNKVQAFIEEGLLKF